MNFYSAPQIHDGSRWLAPNSIIVTDIDGNILDILPNGAVDAGLVKCFTNIITPGFVNAHCHVELSHLKNAIEPNSGLVPFLLQIPQLRNKFTETERKDAAEAAFLQMYSNGIEAIGDIANGTDTVTLRAASGLHIHTFVETMGVVSESAASRFTWSEQVYQQFRFQSNHNTKLLRQSIVPHAPYSVSPELFKIISTFEPEALLSVHNQESLAETELFEQGSGAMLNLFTALQIPVEAFAPSGISSVKSWVPYIANGRSVILVHNTFMQDSDIQFLKNNYIKPWLCLCPNANIYIEGTLPPVEKFEQEGMGICLGTDSLASNNELSIWSEIQTLHKHFSTIPLETIISWATLNGAKALNMDKVLGSIEKGKKPGLVHIDNSNLIERIL